MLFTRNGFRNALYITSATLLLAACSSPNTPSTSATYQLSFANSDSSTNASNNAQALAASTGATDTENVTITNGSSVAVSNLSISVPSAYNSVITPTLASGCSSLAVNGSCTVSLVYTPGATAQTLVNVPLTITYSSTRTSTLYTSITTDGSGVEGFMFGEIGSSLKAPHPHTNLSVGAAAETNEEAFIATSNGMTTKDFGLSTISKVVADPGATDNAWAYGAKTTTQYDVYHYDGSTWSATPYALPNKVIPIALAVSDNGATPAAYLAAIDESSSPYQLKVYKAGANNTWTDTALPSINIVQNSSTVQLKSSGGSALLSVLTYGDNNSNTLAFYSGSAWQSKTTGFSGDLSKIRMAGGNTAFAEVQVNSSFDNSLVVYTTTNSGATWTSTSFSGYKPACLSRNGFCGYSNPGNTTSSSNSEAALLLSNSSTPNTYGLAILHANGTWTSPLALPNMTKPRLIANVKTSTSVSSAMVIGTDTSNNYISDYCTSSVCTAKAMQATASDVKGVNSLSAGYDGYFIEGLYGSSSLSSFAAHFTIGTSTQTWDSFSTPTSMSTIDALVSSPTSQVAYVAGFNSTGHMVYSRYNGASWNTPESFNFMLKNRSTSTFGELQSGNGNLYGIEEAKLKVGITYFKQGAWDPTPIALSSMDNFAWKPQLGFASSPTTCVIGICEERGWLLFASGDQHKWFHFIGTSKTEASTITGLSDIGALYSSKGKAIAIGNSANGQLSLVYYNNPAQGTSGFGSWGTVRRVDSAQYYNGYKAVDNTTVAASNGRFFVLYRANANQYAVAIMSGDAAPNIKTDPLGSGYVPIYLASANGDAWVAGDNGQAVKFAYYDGTAGTWSSPQAITLSGYGDILGIGASTDSTGHAHCYFLLRNTQQDGSRTFEVVEAEGVQQSSPDSLAGLSDFNESNGKIITSNGKAWILGYHQASDSTYYSYFNGTSWATAAAFPVGNITSARPDGAFTRDGQAWFSGTDVSENPKIAFFNGTSWALQPLTGMSDIFQFMPFGSRIMAVGMDNSQNVVMSFYDNDTATWGATSIMANLGIENSQDYTYSGNYQ